SFAVIRHEQLKELRSVLLRLIKPRSGTATGKSGVCVNDHYRKTPGINYRPAVPRRRVARGTAQPAAFGLQRHHPHQSRRQTHPRRRQQIWPHKFLHDRDIGQIHRLVTDSRIPEHCLQALHHLGIDVIIADR
ncbi:TPA: hypothetical protein ACGE6X_004138, partial [Serratia marcescens]